MPLSEKPIHHEPHVETLHRSRDENVSQHFEGATSGQHFDATLPATVIVERETEPTRTIVEYEKVPMELAGGGSYFGDRPQDREFRTGVTSSELQNHDFSTEQREFTERPFGGSAERQFSAPPNENIAGSYGSMAGAEPVRRERGSLSESARLDEQGKHFQGMMDQEIKNEEAFEEGRRHIRQDDFGPQHHHHHHHHRHHDRHNDEPHVDERGAAQESSRGLKSNSSDRDLPQTHSSAAAHNADENPVKPAPSGAAQPPPFDKEAPAPLADKAPANPKDAFPESKNQPVKGNTGNAPNAMDSNQSSAGRRDTSPTDTHPNPNTTGAKDGTSGRADGGMDQPHQLPKDAELSQNKDTTDAALSKDRLPKEGAGGLPKEGAGGLSTGSRPPGSADRVLPKDGAGSRPPGSADRVLPGGAPGGVGAVGSNTAPTGVPPGSTAPLPPAATSNPDLDAEEDDEHHKGMRGKMHNMKEKMKETLHIGHHKEENDDENDEKDPHLKDKTAMGGPITTTK